ncbi:trichohyalin-like [Palaemon carinicauda]|uniref:trichohyalin-like n=1 Tax=Palaemon carinicauda TaxID=392227 RepID=UPI0035B596C2
MPRGAMTTRGRYMKRVFVGLLIAILVSICVWEMTLIARDKVILRTSEDGLENLAEEYLKEMNEREEHQRNDGDGDDDDDYDEEEEEIEEAENEEEEEENEEDELEVVEEEYEEEVDEKGMENEEEENEVEMDNEDEEEKEEEMEVEEENEEKVVEEEYEEEEEKNEEDELEVVEEEYEGEVDEKGMENEDEENEVEEEEEEVENDDEEEMVEEENEDKEKVVEENEDEEKVVEENEEEEEVVEEKEEENEDEEKVVEEDEEEENEDEKKVVEENEEEEKVEEENEDEKKVVEENEEEEKEEEVEENENEEEEEEEEGRSIVNPATGNGNEDDNDEIDQNQDLDFPSVVGDIHWNEETETPERRISLRQQFMEERCQKADISKESFKKIRSQSIGVFFRQKTVTCLANKSGSTTWRTHLQRVNRSPSIYQQKDKRWKVFMKQPNLPEVISQCARVITVRHPLMRLVSAYRQRFENGKIPKLYVWNRKSSYMRKYFSTYWLPAVISNDLIPAEERKKMGLPEKHKIGKLYPSSLLKTVHKMLGVRFVLPFSMFLKHVIYTHKHNIVDNHWMPIDRLCSPCLLHYNFVVKLETMKEDLNYVFKELGIPSEPSIMKNKERSAQNPWGDIRRYQKVPLELKKQILRIYWNDIFLFGYKLPPGFLNE